jgi:hypothetical protein
MDGDNVGKLSFSIFNDHRGFASRISGSSIVCPHPQGHLMLMLQSSPPSRRSAKFRHGNFGGSSSSNTNIRRTGKIASKIAKIQSGHFIG